MKGECAMRRQAKKEGRKFEYPPIGSQQMDEAEAAADRANERFYKSVY